VALVDCVLEYEVVVHVEAAEDARYLERTCGVLGVWGLGGSYGEYDKDVFVEVGVHGREHFLLAAALVTSTSTSMALWAASSVGSIHGGIGYEFGGVLSVGATVRLKQGRS